MSRVYHSNEPTQCVSENVPTKAEIKERIKRAGAHIDKYNSHLDVLASMMSTYSYNQNHLYEMIGVATVELAIAKQELKRK